MDEQPGEFWFPAKRYGWGWGIANCWQGLLVQIGYVVLVIAASAYLVPRGLRAEDLLVVVALTALFVLIHWVKGEKPRWRWGDG